MELEPPVAERNNSRLRVFLSSFIEKIDSLITAITPKDPLDAVKLSPFPHDQVALYLRKRLSQPQIGKTNSGTDNKPLI